LDIVLGVSMAPASIQMVVLEGENADGATVDEDEFDVTAADALSELDDTLNDAGIELCFAEMKDPVKDKLKRFGLFKRLGEQSFFPTIGEAVETYNKVHHTNRKEWEDRES